MTVAARATLGAVMMLGAAGLSACSPTPGASFADDPVVALVNGAPLRASALIPALLDLAGVQALREHVLDQMLVARRAAAGLSVSDAAIDEEIVRLRREWSNADVGPERLHRIAERNATLRALVRPSVMVTDAQIEQLNVIRHGPRARVSVIVVSDERVAADVLTRVRGASDAVFAAAAQSESIDASSARGGSLGVISPADPALPLGLRNAVSDAAVGDTLGPILVPSGVAIVRVHELVHVDVKAFKSFTSGDRDALRAELRERQEQLAMEMLAERLIAQAEVSVMHARMHKAWLRATDTSSPR